MPNGLSCLNITSRLDKANSQFFDESSVVVTSGNRIFGSGYRGRQQLKFKDMLQTQITLLV